MSGLERDDQATAELEPVCLYETDADLSQAAGSVIGNCVEVVRVLLLPPRLRDVFDTVGDFANSANIFVFGDHPQAN